LPLAGVGIRDRTPDGITEVLDECVASVGLERLQCLHVNDSKTELGSTATPRVPDEGEIGAEAWLRSFRAALPGVQRSRDAGPSGTIGLPEVQLARELRRRVLR